GARPAKCPLRPPVQAVLAPSSQGFCRPIALRPTRSECCWPPSGDRVPVPPGSSGFPISKRRDELLAIRPAKTLEAARRWSPTRAWHRGDARALGVPARRLAVYHLPRNANLEPCRHFSAESHSDRHLQAS